MASDSRGHEGRRSKARSESLSFEARFRIFCLVIGALLLGLSAAVLASEHLSAGIVAAILVVLAFLLLFAFMSFFELAVRPLQTLSNVVSALREEDYSFRARGASRDDALGELSREINALADMLQGQRLKALEAVALLQRVMAEIDAPLLAFDQDARLRLSNPAAERALALNAARDIGKSAEELNITGLLSQSNEGIWQHEVNGRAVRWMIRRSRFRQRGVPHTLVLLSDVSAALREEEQLAWKRLIRVLGHEISNSLAPIKSIAGSLHSRLSLEQLGSDFERGLTVIESRADSLHRFVQSYRQLAQLPPPTLQQTALVPLLDRAILLETRLQAHLLDIPQIEVCADADQLEQLFINLLRNAVEAATSSCEDLAFIHSNPTVTISGALQDGFVSVVIEDNGPGLANPANLFVPFYTTKKSGTGVGLALARQIAEAHGGTLELRNRTHAAGCEAEVRLPVGANGKT